MIKQSRKLWILAAAAGLLALAAPMMALEPAIGQEKLEAMAKTASTSEEHAAVAGHYRKWADALDSKASLHEEAAAKHAKQLPAMAHKWPAMAYNHPAQKEKRLAVQARRAANEARQVAMKHVALSVELRAKV
ncbi:MAG: hypothetical protein R2729_02655 [Bryobacteraceae bacterium]